VIYVTIIRRLREVATTFERRVGGTALFEALSSDDNTDIPLPYAFVVPLHEVAESNEDLSTPQMVYERFGIVVAVDNKPQRDDGLGLIALDELRALRQELFNGLLGWSPLSYLSDVSYVGGRHLKMTRARLWHQYEFTFKYQVNRAERPEDNECWPLQEAYARVLPEGAIRPPGTEGFVEWYPAPPGDDPL
jgi:hypothetical protein